MRAPCGRNGRVHTVMAMMRSTCARTFGSVNGAGTADAEPFDSGASIASVAGPASDSAAAELALRRKSRRSMGPSLRWLGDAVIRSDEFRRSLYHWRFTRCLAPTPALPRAKTRKGGGRNGKDALL